jgi:hypothetical protein
MNFFTTDQINGYSDPFNSIHESFGRNVLILKESKRVLIQEINDKYNYYYSRDGNSKNIIEEEIPVSGVFKMRIQWQNPANEAQSSDISDIRPKIHDNMCRLKMKKDAFDFLNGYKKIVIDGKNCEWIGFSRPHGLINVDFYTIFVKETN